jgi:hypothetical protein
LHRNTEGDVVMPATTVIRKYGNRRLYDTSTTRYINLDEIAGTEVQVVDANTGEDLTSVTLRLHMHDPHCSPLAVQAELDTTVPQRAPLVLECLWMVSPGLSTICLVKNRATPALSVQKAG